MPPVGSVNSTFTAAGRAATADAHDEPGLAGSTPREKSLKLEMRSAKVPVSSWANADTAAAAITSAEHRIAATNETKPARGIGATSLMQMSAAEREAATKLGPELVLALQRAFAKTPRIAKRDRIETLAILAQSKDGKARAAAALLDEKIADVDGAVLARLRANDASRPKNTWSLVDWARRQATARACKGVHGAVVRPLRAALKDTSSADYFWPAIERIETIKQHDHSSRALADVLVAKKCLPGEDKWKITAEFLPKTDAVAELAGQPARPRVLKKSKPRMRPLFLMIQKQILARGLLDTEKWIEHTSSLSTARGIVGEELRLLQIDQEPARVEREVVQGVFTMVAPPGLWACESSQSANQWCANNGKSDTGLCRVVVDGRGHYGYLPTEVDVAVLNKCGDQWTIQRIENVKAGTGLSGHARDQNGVARQALADRHLHFCVPAGNDEFEDWTSRIDRSPEALGAIEYSTVGPSDDSSYDVKMPLSDAEIVELSKRLLLADWDDIKKAA